LRFVKRGANNVSIADMEKKVIYFEYVFYVLCVRISGVRTSNRAYFLKVFHSHPKKY